MVEATITVDGTEIPANDVIEAIENAGGPGDVREETGVSGEVVVQYDWANDGDAYLIFDGEQLTDGTYQCSGRRMNMNDVYDAAQNTLDAGPEWLDDYDGFSTVEYVHDSGHMWDVMGVIEVDDRHGSMLVNGPIPEEATLKYVNNPAIANDEKNYYGADVPEESVVFFMADERAE